jgi:RNA polymerase sigma-70 factor, ECF subfamily
MEEDKRLLVQLGNGSQDALCRLYEKYKDGLIGLAMAVSGDRNLAEDALQDVFVTLASRAGEIRVHTNLKGYLSSMIVNRIRNLMRESKPSQDPSAAGFDGRLPKSTSGNRALLIEEVEIIYRALRRLPAEQSEAIWLHLHAGLTFRQIAKTNNLSIATVHSRYRYGLQKMRTLLDGQVEIDA